VVSATFWEERGNTMLGGRDVVYRPQSRGACTRRRWASYNAGNETKRALDLGWPAYETDSGNAAHFTG
jgi:hypothetical protein